MSMTAARFVTVRFGNSGSAHVPDLKIFPGRYITAECPVIGLVPTVLHAPVATFSVRVVVSGPASKTLPSGRRNICG